jgi:hypothetical protein
VGFRSTISQVRPHDVRKAIAFAGNVIWRKAGAIKKVNAMVGIVLNAAGFILFIEQPNRSRLHWYLL